MFKKSTNKDKTKNMIKLEAYKMDGLGNDFIIFDNRKKSIALTKGQIIKIADRNNIGCDQVIFIDKDQNSDAFVKFYNADGGETPACGNGSRCVAYLLMKEKNVKKKLMDEMKNSEIFKSVMDKFPDAELIDVNSKKDGVDND